MTTIVFVSSPSQDPFLWRRVADFLPPAWAVAAPDLSDCETMDDVVEAIDRDAAGVSEEPIILVAEGSGARAALAFANERPDRTQGLLFSAPRFSRSMKDALRGAGRTLTRRTSPYDSAIASDRDRAIPTRIRSIILHPEKSGRAPAGENVRVIGQASADWFRYAPDAFAANISQFVDDLEVDRG